MLLPPLVGGIIVAAVLGAMMSTIDSILLLAGSLVVENVYIKFMKREVDSGKGLKIARYVTLILGVLSLLVATVPPVLLMSVHAEFKMNEEMTAEGLTRMQIEYIKGSPYIYANETNPYPEYNIVPVPNESYRIEVVIQPIAEDYSDLPAGQDEGYQKIKVIIYHSDEKVMETLNIKVAL